jgi:hypothetical protein
MFLGYLSKTQRVCYSTPDQVSIHSKRLFLESWRALASGHGPRDRLRDSLDTSLESQNITQLSLVFRTKKA